MVLIAAVVALGVWLLFRDAAVVSAPTPDEDAGTIQLSSATGDGSWQETLREVVDTRGEVTQLIVDTVTVGEGEPVEEGDTITVHYVGTVVSGQEFDNSRERNQPFTFTVGEGDVISGWDEGVVGMRPGGSRILVIPSEMGYGAEGYGPIPGGATLLFAVELLSIE